MNKKSGFKMKGHTLPGINQRSETPNTPDGRSKSSAFQMGTSMGAINTAKKTKAGKGTLDASRKAKGAANMAKTKASQKIMSGGKSKFQADVAANKIKRADVASDAKFFGAHRKAGTTPGTPKQETVSSKTKNISKSNKLPIVPTTTPVVPNTTKSDFVATKSLKENKESISGQSLHSVRKANTNPWENKKEVDPKNPAGFKKKSPTKKKSAAKKHKKSAVKKHKKSPVYKKGYHTMPDGTIMKDSEHKKAPAKKHKKSPTKNYKKGYYGA